MMKNGKSSFRIPLLTILLWVLNGVALATFTWSCIKENQEPEPPETTRERPYPAVTIDPSEVIAFIDPSQKRLYVDPQYMEVVLEQFEARPIGQETFMVTGKSFAGNMVEYPVRLIYMPAPAIFETANATISALPTTQDVVLQGTDPVTGIPMRLRRNWDCGQEWRAFVSQCQDLDNGTSKKTDYLAAKTCQKKDGAFCPEEYGVWAIEYTYSAKGCGGTPAGDPKPIRNWVCKG